MPCKNPLVIPLLVVIPNSTSSQSVVQVVLWLGMHRVDPKHKRAAMLRIVAYSITLILTVITTVLLLFFALGYRLGGSGNVVRSGLLLVDNKPEAAAVFINNESKDGSTPSRFVLSAGRYNLALKRTGYRDWSKQVSIAASGVREVEYPILIPNKLSSKSVLQSVAPSFVTQSPSRKFLVTHTPNQTAFSLIELDPESPKQTELAFSNVINRENGSVGTFKLIEWALNNKQLLLEQTLPSGAVHLISFDITKPDEAVDITDLYGSQAPSDIHYVGGNTEVVYGIKDGMLSKYSLTQAQQTLVLRSVRSYQPYSDDTVLFERLTATQKSEVGILKDTTQTVIHTANDSGAVLLKYAKYEDHFYYVVAEPKNNTVTIYRDPLKHPILAKQLPFITLTFENAQKVNFSGSSQFVLVQNGKQLLTYDFNDFRQFGYTLPFDPAPNTYAEWINGTHIASQAADGMNHLLEYDGQNQQQLLASRTGLRLYYGEDYQTVYRMIDSGTNVSLEATSLLVTKK